jgi:hypothetical protein
VLCGRIINTLMKYIENPFLLEMKRLSLMLDLNDDEESHLKFVIQCQTLKWKSSPYVNSLFKNMMYCLNI